MRNALADSGRRFAAEVLSERRSYGSFADTAAAESKMPLGERIDFVSIVTLNKMHFPVAKAFGEAGINIVCEKPVTYSLTLVQHQRRARPTLPPRKRIALCGGPAGYPAAAGASGSIY